MAFERAYELRPTPQIGYNLGLAELETGRYVQAARHIGLYIHQTPRPTKEERRALAEAERHVAHLMFDVNVEGAHIFIDDESQGRTPFVFQPIYVLAGRHTIRATCEGFSDVTLIHDVEAGRQTDIKITLEPAKPSAAPPTTRPAPPPSSSTPGERPAPTPKKDTREPSPARAGVDSRTAILIAGATLTVAGGVLALVEGLRASSADSDFTRITRSDELAGASACSSIPTPTCRELTDAAQRHDDALRLMRGAVIGTALVGAATTATWFLWPRSSGVRLAPQVQSSMTGIVFLGDFQ